MKPPKKLSNLQLVILFVLFAAVVIAAQAWLWQSRDDVGTSRPQDDTITVNYRVHGNDAYLADLTYTNETGNIEQVQGVLLPWGKTLTVPRGQVLTLSGQSADDNNKTITCEISIGGQIKEQASSTGRFAVASCSGSAE